MGPGRGLGSRRGSSSRRVLLDRYPRDGEASLATRTESTLSTSRRLLSLRLLLFLFELLFLLLPLVLVGALLVVGVETEETEVEEGDAAAAARLLLLLVLLMLFKPLCEDKDRSSWCLVLAWLLLPLLLLFLCLREERDGFEEVGSGMNGTVKPVFAVLITLLGGNCCEKVEGLAGQMKRENNQRKVLSK